LSEAILDRPQKTREFRNHHMDSTYWNGFQFRDDDVIVGSYAKSGTTWTQQICAQLIFAGDPDVAVAEISPWWDMRIVPEEVRDLVRAQQHRRIIKTHLPADALVMSDKAKYLYVARDGRDVVWSMHNHHTGFRPETFDLFNQAPGPLVGEPFGPADPDIRRYFRAWLERDGHPFWPFWENTATWWALRRRPNVKLVHFANLKADLEGEMRKIAEFLEVELSHAEWARAVRHCTFDWMKANAPKVAPLGGDPWEGGADTFINKGVNGRWRDVLSPQESAAYERRAVAELGPACARWLATGEGL
jgi:aryl sulfotransferase